MESFLGKVQLVLPQKYWYGVMICSDCLFGIDHSACDELCYSVSTSLLKSLNIPNEYRSGIAITSTYAIGQCSRLLKVSRIPIDILQQITKFKIDCG